MGGFDLSVLLLFVVGGMLYFVLLMLYLELDGVYGLYGCCFVCGGKGRVCEVGVLVI